ncbi:MAG: hypothetical protein ABJ246_19665 [Paracoccaceae bacterium]
MNDDIQQHSFIDTLLDRSEGHTQGFKPVIKPYFQLGTVSDGPIIEEAQNELETDATAVRDRDAQTGDRTAAQMQTHDQTQSIRPHVREQEVHADQQLMPIASEIEPAIDESTAHSSENGNAPPAPAIKHEHRTTHSTIFQPVPSEPVPITDSSDTSKSHTNPNQTKPADFSTQLATAIARLTSNPPQSDDNDTAQEAPIMPLAATPDLRPVGPVPADASPSARDPNPEVHIHIGEIVIEAENNVPASNESASPARPKWAPQMSLDAYRDARRKGQR